MFSQDWDTAEYMKDPDAKKPDDWDEDMDGEWEPPMIPNPEYKVGYRMACQMVLRAEVVC